MKLICAPESFAFPAGRSALPVVLFARSDDPAKCSAGAAVLEEIARQKLVPAQRAWDFLALALAVAVADHASARSKSPDGWTRDLELEVAVAEKDFWNSQAATLETAVAFLTTDRWRMRMTGGGNSPEPPPKPVMPKEAAVALLSGGLDSLVGVIDLVASEIRPLAVSQTVRGDGEKQERFAQTVGGGLSHLQLNPNIEVPRDQETSQRSRSLVFLAFGVLAATSLAAYHDGATVTLYACENGFIAMNPPLTPGRVGSLSTRTAHPTFLAGIQRVLDAAGIRVRIENPYRLKTKGEMLLECADQDYLRKEAAKSTSCGRFQRFKYQHCGRCVPCQVRRAAFLKWGVQDTTKYVHSALGKNDLHHAGFDDVRSVGIAIAQERAIGLDRWLSASLSSIPFAEQAPLRSMIGRGLTELEALHTKYGVK
ncbi:MAG: 7-cyano-7-deazaguanine synthase [Planctomycetes bacterium]|nr:7-cyano-7-deazaguanine synthase [Planctomycetota bacterium]